MKTFTVTPCTWYDKMGWSFDGWAGETPREAVYEAVLNGTAGVTTDDAFGPATFVDSTTGKTISE